MSPRDAGKPDPLNNPSKFRQNPTVLRAVPPVREFPGDLGGQGGRGGAALAASGPDASALFRALKRRWLLAATLGTVLAVAAAVGAWFLLTPKFTVAAILHISAHPQNLFQNTPEGRSDFQTYQKTLAARIKHPKVLLAALKEDEVKRLNLVSQQPDPILWLQDEIKVESQEGSELVKVSMAGEDPAELMVLVNAVTKAWYDETVKVEKDQRSESVEQLGKIVGASNEALRIKREDLKRRAKEAGTSEAQVLTEQQKALMATFAVLQNGHSDIKFKLMNAEAELVGHKARLKSSKEIAVPEGELDEAVEADPQVKGLTARVLWTQERLDRVVNAFADDDSIVLDRRRQLQAAESAREVRRGEVRKLLAERYRRRAQKDQDGSLAQLEEKTAILKVQEQSLQAEIDKLKAQMKTVGDSSVDLELEKAAIAHEENLVNRMAEALKIGQIELERPDRVNLYQEAGLQRRDIKRQVLGTAAAPIAALLGVCLCVSWWEYRGRRIHSTDEVVKGLGMRIVGAVPALSQAGDGQFFADKEQDREGQNLLESIDAIRTVLLRDASVAATRVVMVTSAMTGEGKTMLAGHLASSLARAGRRTLLVDGDLRTPAAHQLLEQTLQPGLSEVLLEEINLPEAVRPATAVEGLWLLPAGLWDREVLHALAQDGPQRIFEQLREEFDFVVVDSHPVLAATDALLLGQHVDAVILSVLRDVSQVPLVSAAVQRLTSLGIRVLGAVVNGVGPEDVYSQGNPYPAQVPVR